MGVDYLYFSFSIEKSKLKLCFFSFGLALNMVGALVYMHSRYSAARDLYETQLEAEEDEERNLARAQPSTQTTTGAKYSQVWQEDLSLIPLPVVNWPRNKIFIIITHKRDSVTRVFWRTLLI